jgi:hypothetical protein
VHGARDGDAPHLGVEREPPAGIELQGPFETEFGARRKRRECEESKGNSPIHELPQAPERRDHLF